MKELNANLEVVLNKRELTTKDLNSIPIILEAVDDSTIAPLISRSSTGAGISVADKKMIHVFIESEFKEYLKIIAHTGSISYKGSSSETKSEVIRFTPDSQINTLNPGISNVVITSIGKAFNSLGEVVKVTFFYDKFSKSITVNSPCYAFCSIQYLQKYYKYLYKFSGHCPIKQKDSKPTDYTNGEILALCAVEGKAGSANLSLNAPQCNYGNSSFSNNSEAILPTISLSTDPNGEPRFVSAGNTNIAAQSVLRFYANGQFPDSLGSTSGAIGLLDGLDSEIVIDILIFNNTSTASLSKNPASGVEFEVLSNLSGADEFVGPGNNVTDVTWIDNFNYKDPIRRSVGLTEVVATNFGISNKSTSVVKATYRASFCRILVEFEYEFESKSFLPLYVFASMEDGRSCSMEVSPPTTYSQTVGY